MSWSTNWPRKVMPAEMLESWFRPGFRIRPSGPGPPCEAGRMSSRASMGPSFAPKATSASVTLGVVGERFEHAAEAVTAARRRRERPCLRVGSDPRARSRGNRAGSTRTQRSEKAPTAVSAGGTLRRVGVGQLLFTPQRARSARSMGWRCLANVYQNSRPRSIDSYPSHMPTIEDVLVAAIGS